MNISPIQAIVRAKEENVAVAVKISEAAARELFIKNDLEPLDEFPGTQKPWRSLCVRTGKEVSPTYGKVRDFGHRCQYCSGYKVDPQEAIKVMKESGFKPLIDYPGSNSPWKSECLGCGKTTSPTFSSVSKGIGCKFCSGRAVEPRDAIAAMRGRGFETLEDFPGATTLWQVRCLGCKREFKTYFHSLKTDKRCKYCAGVAIDEAVIVPVLESLHLKPLEPFPGAKSPWKMRCLRCNRVVCPSWTHLTRKDRNVGGCVYCSRRRVHMDDIAELLAQNQLRPIGHFVNGKTPWLCQCLKCEREVYPRVSDLRQGQSGCMYCACVRVDVREANELANKCGFTPLVPYPGANTPWECVCNVCGKASKPRYTTMQQGGSQCKYCATGGFDFNEPAIVYLITHQEFNAHKIGVAGATTQNERLKHHSKQGWKVHKHTEFELGSDAFEVERKVLQWLRYERNLQPFLSAEQMPQAGWTETVDGNEIDLPTIWKKVETLRKEQR
jgi:hypothetical protein